MPDLNNISVAIPNWNGEAVLPDCLKSLKRAFEIAGFHGPGDIVIADDQSTDSSLAVVEAHFPEVRLHTMPQRSGFGVTANKAVQLCENDYVLLLNNDVYVEENFFKYWADHFADPNMFAVSSWMLRWDRTTVDSGKRVAVWDKGLIRHWVVQDQGQLAPSFYACGGASVYDRHKFLQMGGFDPLYRPMYTEDLDISYVAWKRGWKVLYEPACVVYHHNSFSSGRVYNQRQKYLHDTKNHYLFVWKNITDPHLFRTHLTWLPIRVAAAPFHGRRLLTASFFQALRQLDEARRGRAIQKGQVVISDQDLFDQFQPTPHDLAHSPYQGTAGAS